MTEEEIDALTAGQHLDWLIETQVFGVEPWLGESAVDCVVPPRPARSRNIDRILPARPRQFSSHPQSMMLVLERLTQQTESLTIDYFSTPKQWIVWSSGVRLAEGSSMAEALCRCLLKVETKT